MSPGTRRTRVTGERGPAQRAGSVMPAPAERRTGCLESVSDPRLADGSDCAEQIANFVLRFDDTGVDLRSAAVPADETYDPQPSTVAAWSELAF